MARLYSCKCARFFTPCAECPSDPTAATQNENKMTPREVWEQRKHDLDEYLADMAYDRLKEVHDNYHKELRDDCRFCKEEKENDNGQ